MPLRAAELFVREQALAVGGDFGYDEQADGGGTEPKIHLRCSTMSREQERFSAIPPAVQDLLPNGTAPEPSAPLAAAHNCSFWATINASVFLTHRVRNSHALMTPPPRARRTAVASQ